MAKRIDPDVALRRELLGSYVEKYFHGPTDFARQAKINQGLVSGAINGSKSFGPKFAITVEEGSRRTAHPMEKDYLRRPQRPGTEKADVPADLDVVKALDHLQGDILFIRTVVNTVISAVTRSIPDAGEKMWASLQNVEGKDQKYLAEVLGILEKLGVAGEDQSTDARRQPVPLAAKKIRKQSVR